MVKITRNDTKFLNHGNVSSIVSGTELGIVMLKNSYRFSCNRPFGSSDRDRTVYDVHKMLIEAAKESKDIWTYKWTAYLSDVRFDFEVMFSTAADLKKFVKNLEK